MVLFGSYARGVITWRSDVDILVLLQKPRRIKVDDAYGIHIHVGEKREFKRRFVEGDDFAVSAVRYGKLLRDRSDFWASLQQCVSNIKWPDPRAKLKHAERRIKMGNELLKMGDIEATTEEYLFGATHIARAILLRNGVYPLSRPEMSQQLRELGQNELADHLDALIDGNCGEEQLQRIARDLSISCTWKAQRIE